MTDVTASATIPIMKVSFVVVSPVRNEERYLQGTIDSFVAQTIRPSTWVIVDDGSSDATPRIAEKAAQAHPWIKVVRRPDRGFRHAGGGVIEAFYEGYPLVAQLPWDFLVKLDGDVSFAPDYFERCFARFEANPRLGIAGGTISNLENGQLKVESSVDPSFHVRGATKIYRRACWEAIGGLIQAPGWDTVDEVKANSLAWETRTFPDLLIQHHRHAGAAYGTWANYIKGGKASYIAGYHPLFMTAKCLSRLYRKPYLVAGLGLFCGFWKCFFTGTPRVKDPELLAYFRRQQFNRLLGRKSLWSQ
jgi:poly-beta-1,6-N-acetyl-D-glucosamine synthase